MVIKIKYPAFKRVFSSLLFIDIAYSMYQHALRLHATWLSHTPNSSTRYAQSLFDKAAGQYLKAMGSMRNKVASSLSRYDLHAMGCGVVLLWQVWNHSNSIRFGVRPGITDRQWRPWPPLPMLLALVPLQRFQIDFHRFQWKCVLQNENGLALSKMKFQS